MNSSFLYHAWGFNIHECTCDEYKGSRIMSFPNFGVISVSTKFRILMKCHTEKLSILSVCPCALLCMSFSLSLYILDEHKKEYQENLILFLFMLDFSAQITCHPPSSSSSQREHRGHREMYQQQRC